MPGHPCTQEPIQVSFILFPGFALTSFALAIEALSVANLISEQELYRYNICSAVDKQQGGRVVSSNLVPVETTANLEQCLESDLVFIGAYKDAANFEDHDLLSMLRILNRRKARLATLSGGSFILARAGLIADKSCTLVPEFRTTFAELYPDYNLQENLYTVYKNTFTSAGGTSTLDMMFYLISLDYGREFAYEMTEMFLQDRIRSSEEMQSSRRILNLRIKSPTLGAAVELMEKHIAEPYPIATLASSIGTTQRNLETVFQKHVQTTPSRYYLTLRLKQARHMLEETHLSIANIAQATGFSSQSHFSKCFRDLYDIRPSDLRP
ncbi:MAG: GlxA family transcriptional regulator [Amphritea sp.]|nr:GlxA family transcriptional regulator [Amphritea sp.]